MKNERGNGRQFVSNAIISLMLAAVFALVSARSVSGQTNQGAIAGNVFGIGAERAGIADHRLCRNQRRRVHGIWRIGALERGNHFRRCKQTAQSQTSEAGGF